MIGKYAQKDDKLTQGGHNIKAWQGTAQNRFRQTHKTQVIVQTEKHRLQQNSGTLHETHRKTVQVQTRKHNINTGIKALQTPEQKYKTKGPLT